MKRTKSQLHAISRYYSKVARENWQEDYNLLVDIEDKKVYCAIDKKYKYTECKKRALRKYLREKYGNDTEARKIK